MTNPDGSVALDREEFPRPETTLESLSGLKTVFDVVRDVPVEASGTTYGQLIQRKYPDLENFNHIHHAGNSSGVVDGAAALLLASEGLHTANRTKTTSASRRYSQSG